MIKGEAQFAPWSEDPDPPDYWDQSDYENMRKRLRAYWDGIDVSDKYDPDEDRDQLGKWTAGGGGSKASKSKGSGRSVAEVRQREAKGGVKKDDLGSGYSASAHLENGVIKTDNVYDAVLALHQDRPVELKQPKQVSTLIKLLGEETKHMVEAKEHVPNFDLCKVTVKGSNLFCADTKGIPRVKMPQMDDKQTKDFIHHLKDLGFHSEKDVVKSAHLRATQNQLDTAKVNKFFERIKKDKDFKGDDKRLVISNDDYVLDGHHHWAAQIAADAMDNKLGDHKTKVFRVDIPIIPLYKLAMKFTGGKGAKGQGDSGFDDALGFVDWDESKVTRVPAGSSEGGQFGSGGGSHSSSSSENQPTESDIAKELKLEPKAVDVGGDDWNKSTAIRLEKQYQSVKPEMETLLKTYETGQAPKEEPSNNAFDEPDEQPEYDGPSSPDEWDVLSDDAQSQIEEEYYSSALPDYIQSEVQNWHDMGGALDQAKSNLADSDTWKIDQIKELLGTTTDEDGNVTKNSELDYPFSYHQLADATDLYYDSDGEGGGSLKVKINDEMLREYKADPNQETLPGIEKPDYAKLLTGEMRAELKTTLKANFQTEAEDQSHLEEPPDFTDQAKDFMDENWSGNMTGEDKYQWAKNNTSIISDLQDEYDKAYSAYEAGEADVGPVIGIPETFDPLNKTSGADYKRTQAIARRMSLDRAEKVLDERGIVMKPGVVPKTALRRLDSDLWTAWKGSSTSEDGQLLQVATADELGGRLNPTTGKDGRIHLDKDAIRRRADKEYEGIGGYDAIKGYVRAKWETTQFLLDKAGMQDLELYRGIALDDDKLKIASEGSVKEGGYIKAPTLKVVRNGAASTTFNPDVANGWSSDYNRAVLRAHVPRTAAISVPAYGINVKSEQEVVVAGTAWKKWDAWLKKAPRFSDVKMAA